MVLIKMVIAKKFADYKAIAKRKTEALQTD